MMETILQGLTNIYQCHIDDILVTGTGEQEHLYNLEEVLKCLSEYGTQVEQESVYSLKTRWSTYLGHLISEEEIHTIPKKIQAIQTTPAQKIYKSYNPFLDCYTITGNLA